MLTFQDFEKSKEKGEADEINFILSAINEHEQSPEFRQAVIAERYYDGENVTIGTYEKIIYDMQGRAHADMYTANHKIASQFFGMEVDQEISYLLGNGVTYKSDTTKDKLGDMSDETISDIATYACIHGVSYGFWNNDHIDVFKMTEFKPLPDERTGAIKSGIRFWRLDKTKPMFVTLYEMDGYTEYQTPADDAETSVGNNGLIITHEKSSYKRTFRTSAAEGEIEIGDGENYPSFPIVPLKRNKKEQSELAGKRNTVDALDLAVSNMVNNVDEGNLIYWVLTNCFGMDDLDDVKFLDRLRTLHVAHVDSARDGATAEPHTIEAPFEGTSVTIDMITKRLFSDFQAFDADAVTASNQSATAIRASYVPLDLKVDKLERQVTRFIKGILKLAGIDDTPSYTRNRIVNSQEEVQTIVMAARYLDDEYVTRKILTVLGDADQAEEVLRLMSAEHINRLGGLGTAGGADADERDQ